MSAIDTAMVLAAGLSTRMRPITDQLPKPLVRLQGRALIDHVLDRLAGVGITRAVVNVHYYPDQIEAHLAFRTKSRPMPDIAISDERGVLLDTGGGVSRALRIIGDKPFFVHNSDSVWSEGSGLTLARMRDAWNPDRMDVLMLLAPTATSLGYAGSGDFTMEPDGLLARRPENGVAPFVFAGVSITHPKLFENAPEGRFSLNVLWDRALDKGRLFGVRHDGIWMHVGSPGALAEAEGWLQRGEG